MLPVKKLATRIPFVLSIICEETEVAGRNLLAEGTNS
jgi:hypothetical protein